MKEISSVKRIIWCAVCVALCYVLPVAFHAVGLGTVLSPMHIPVLLCGLVCGGFYGAVCGVFGPILSSVLSGMPPAAMLVTMIPELLVYGLTAGLCIRFLRLKNEAISLYAALALAMLLGRVAGGIAKMLFYMGSGQSFTLAIWVSSYFVTAVPGIICHLILVPVLYVTLKKARVLPQGCTVGA